MDAASSGLSVVIVAWNSREALARTLPPLLAELGDRDELVVVDNASDDGSTDLVRELAPAARLVELPENHGFAAGANAGAEASTGDLLVFLNPDAVTREGFSDEIRRPLAEGRGWDAWMGLVTAEGGKVINTRGGVLHFTGIAWAGGAGEPVPAAMAPGEVPFLSGAALAIPRATFARLGGFAPDYFLYHEDVELSLRLRLAGLRIGIEPRAVVDHDYEFGRTSEKYHLLERSRWATVIRTYPTPLLAALLPALLLTELAMIPLSVAGGWWRQKLAANLDVLRSLPTRLRERRWIQRGRAIRAGEFASVLSADLDSPYLGRAGRIAPLRWALRAYWAAVRLVLRVPGHSGLPPGGTAGGAGLPEEATRRVDQRVTQ
jgi:GT2 family glycosyltransferase